MASRRLSGFFIYLGFSLSSIDARGPRQISGPRANLFLFCCCQFTVEPRKTLIIVRHQIIIG